MGGVGGRLGGREISRKDLLDGVNPIMLEIV